MQEVTSEFGQRETQTWLTTTKIEGGESLFAAASEKMICKRKSQS